MKCNNWIFMRCKVFGVWLWIPCRMKKKKATGRHGDFLHVSFLQSKEYLKFVKRRYEREGYYKINNPLFKQFYL